MHFVNRKNSEILLHRQLRYNFFLLVLTVIFQFPAIGQQRNADQIITIKNDTLTVKILEVKLNEIKYQDFESDKNHTIAKGTISKVLYGNGESEEFANSERFLDKAVSNNPDSRYYKMVVATPFQKSITQWPDQKLFSEQKRYRNIASTNLFLGITSIVAGSVMFTHGILTIFDSNHSAGFIIGGVFTGTLGIPLLAFRNKAKKRNKFIEMEIERRSFKQLPALIHR